MFLENGEDNSDNEELRMSFKDSVALGMLYAKVCAFLDVHNSKTQNVLDNKKCFLPQKRNSRMWTVQV